MANNIEVEPSRNQNAVQVATKVIDGVHYPVYLAATKDGFEDETNLELSVLLSGILTELKKMNAYNAMAHNSELDSEDIE